MHTTRPVGPAARLCTLQTCPIECAQVEFLPTLAGNTLYAVILAFLLLAQIGLGIWYRMWGFMVGLFCGYLIPLTIGPAFLTASIYLCLARLTIAYSSELSRLRPRTYAIGFMCSDFVSLLLQAAGGALAAITKPPKVGNTGRNVMVAGLVIRVIPLVIFTGFWLDFLLAVRKAGESERDSNFAKVTPTRRCKGSNYALFVASILILARSIYRVIELQGGFKGAVASNEAAFMIFEGPIIMLVVFLLTVFHPGFAFAGKWHTAAWALKRKEANEKMDSTYELMAKRDESDA